ncbi:MAG: LacI family DNA-binding transcriptional regulator [Verrucomicrobiia bacterium]
MSGMKTIGSTAELASLLGLSRWTVSRVFNNHPGIAPETSQRVRQFAAEAGFLPSPLGRGLRSGRTTWVGVLMPDLLDYFLLEKLRHIQRGVEDLGLGAMIQIVDAQPEAERQAMERFTAMRCGALLSVASALPPLDPALAKASQAGVRVVRIDPMFPGASFEVLTHRAFGMKAAVLHLSEQGFLSAFLAAIDPHTGYGKQRVKGLRRGCLEAGWKWPHALRFVPGEGDSEFACGESVGRTLVAQRSGKREAIIALNDRVAFGLINEFRRAGLRVPEDYCVVGYDDSELAQYSLPQLSSINTGVDRLIGAALAMLHPSHSGKRVWIRPRLVVRASSTPLRVSPRSRRP